MKTHTTDNRLAQLEALCRTKQMRAGPGLPFTLTAHEAAQHLGVSTSRSYTLLSYLTASGRLIRHADGFIYPETP